MKKRKTRRKNPLIALLSLFSIVLAIIFVLQVLNMNILPLKLAIPALSIVILVTLLVFILYNFTSRRPIAKFFSGLLVVALTVAYGFGNYYVYKTNDVLVDVTSLTSKMTNTVSVVTMDASKVTKLKELDGADVGICTKVGAKGTNKALDDIESKISIDTHKYSSILEMVYALYNGDVDAIVLNETYRGEIHDQEAYTNFNTDTKVIHKTTYETKRDSVETSKDAVNVTTEAFTVLISGNDSYGGLNDVSRSDSNMLVTVNPNTHTVLMTSIPRDYYVSVACSDSADNACPQGEDDKLTHTGLYGVSTTEETIEDFMDIEINYYARVNFSSLVNLVDALDGIDIEVGKGLAVDTFYANSTLKGVHEGTNHLNGERALAYARERHAYVDGDAQRIKNQQQVLQAIVEKATSASMITHYSSFMEALSGAFETNMSSDDMTSLIRYEINETPDWTFESYALTGESDMQYCASLGDSASVTIPNQSSINTGKKKIQAVLAGKSSESVEDDDQDSYDSYSTDSDDEDTTYDDSSYDDSSDTTYDDSSYYDDSYNSDITYDSNMYNDETYYDPSSDYGYQDDSGNAFQPF